METRRGRGGGTMDRRCLASAIWILEPTNAYSPGWVACCEAWVWILHPSLAVYVNSGKFFNHSDPFLPFCGVGLVLFHQVMSLPPTFIHQSNIYSAPMLCQAIPSKLQVLLPLPLLYHRVHLEVRCNHVRIFLKPLPLKMARTTDCSAIPFLWEIGSVCWNSGTNTWFKFD